MSRPKQFRPDFEVDGPYEGGITGISALVCRWSLRGVFLIVAAFFLGYFGRSLGWL